MTDHDHDEDDAGPPTPAHREKEVVVASWWDDYKYQAITVVVCVVGLWMLAGKASGPKNVHFIPDGGYVRLAGQQQKNASDVVNLSLTGAREAELASDDKGWTPWVYYPETLGEGRKLRLEPDESKDRDGPWTIAPGVRRVRWQIGPAKTAVVRITGP